MSNSSLQHPARPQHPLTLLERVREALRHKHYSYRTERAYISSNVTSFSTTGAT